MKNKEFSWADTKISILGKEIEFKPFEYDKEPNEIPNGIYEIKISDLEAVAKHFTSFEEKYKQDKFTCFRGMKKYVYRFDDYIFEDGETIEFGGNSYLVYDVNRTRILLMPISKKL